MTPSLPLMPELARSQQGFHHTVDSALEIFATLGVSASRISINMAGRGLPSRWVEAQRPAPGTPITSGDTIQLTVAGLGYFHNLPVACWDTGGEAEIGTREILSVLDDPYQKAAHWLREGARLFDIGVGNPDACARWIALFGLNPEHWPEDCWFRLAVLLPSLQSLAGKEFGIRFALHWMLGLPLEALRRKRRFRYLQADQLSLLGQRMGRLGVDLLAGDRVEDQAQVEVVIGPVTLEQYYAFQQPDRKYLLDAVLYLLAPCHQRYVVAWSVEDRNKAPRLGIEQQNSRLGLNAYLGVATS